MTKVVFFGMDGKIMDPWYLLYCKRSEQQRAQVHLERQGVACYYPQMTVEKIRRGKKSLQREPMFPSYIFTSFDPQKISYTTIRSTRGVVNFVRQGALPVMVPSALINFLILKEEEKEVAHLGSNLPFVAGENIALNNGAFEGAAAIFKEPDGEARSIIFVQLLNQSVEVCVENASIMRA